jgi:polar amino acid transport system substrate-binding protein
MRIWAAVGLVAVLAACGSSGSPSSDGASASPHATTTTTIAGLCEGDVSNAVAAAKTFTPMTADTLTVATTLPASGFWNGGDLDATKVTSGYEYDLARQLQKAFGLSTLTVRNLTTDELLDSAGKKFDLALSQLAISCRQARKVQFSQPYIELQQSALVKNSAKHTLRTAADVRRLRWAVSSGSTAEDTLQRFGVDEPRGFDLLDDALDALNRGKVDALLTDTGSALIEAKNSNGKLLVAAQLAQPGGASAYSAVVPPRAKNLAAVNGALRTLKKSQVMKQSAIKNLGADPSTLRVIALPPVP